MRKDRQPKFNPPLAFIPPCKVPQPDGSFLIRAGKPVILDDLIECRKAASVLGLSVRTINLQCEIGLFKSAFKPSGRPHGKWKISRAEVLARRKETE